MLPPMVKEGLRKVAKKVASGEMKPGDTMVMKGKPDMMEGSAEEEKGESPEEERGEFDSLASDMMDAFESKDVKELSSLLEELCQHSKEY